MNVWLTADHHFFHEGMLQHRPQFGTMEEMTDAYVAQWNEVVSRSDCVYHLGDFAITYVSSDATKVDSILRRLHGTKLLIRGNHDRKHTYKSKYWAWQGDIKKIKVGDAKYILSHRPLRTWEGMMHGMIHACGHSHGNLNKHPESGICGDVGVDVWGGYPVNLEEFRMAVEHE